MTIEGGMIPLYRRVLIELDRLTLPHGEACVGFAPIVAATGLDRREVRQIVRHLARDGLADYHTPLWSDRGPAGAGYCITPAGRDAIGRAA